MRTATTVLNFNRERGQRGLPLTNLYRLLYKWDAMFLAKIDHIIAILRQERYRRIPARRIYIPKRNGKRRGLGLPS